MATPSTTDSEDSPSAPLVSCFVTGTELATRRPLLALVPLLSGLLSLDQLERAARADTAFQLNFALPVPLADLWTFLDAPTREGVTVFGYSARTVQRQPELLGRALLVAGGALLLLGLLTAVYLGAIDDALAGRRSEHLANLRQHAPVTLAFAALQFLGLLVLLGIGTLGTGTGSIRGSAGPLVLALLGGIVGLYLLTPGVYVGVAARLGPRTAFDRGIDVALTSEYLAFALCHALAVTAVSVPLSAIGFAGGLGSLVFVALVAAPVGLVLNGATMAFVRSQVDGGVESPEGLGEGPPPAPAARPPSDGADRDPDSPLDSGPDTEG
jgi:hypothetical protein